MLLKRSSLLFLRLLSEVTMPGIVQEQQEGKLTELGFSAHFPYTADVSLRASAAQEEQLFAWELFFHWRSDRRQINPFFTG
jgi:hypothetical protein